MTPQREEAIRFIRLAERDRSTFGILAASAASSIAALGFHAQQAVEKAMKAILIEQAVEFRRTHDLQELADALRESGASFPVQDDRLRLLTPFAVEVRYQVADVSGLDPGEMREIMERVVDWACDFVEKRKSEE